MCFSLLDKEWNAQFQSAMEMPQTSPDEKLARVERIAQIAADFERVATQYAKVIINGTCAHVSTLSHVDI